MGLTDVITKLILVKADTGQARLELKKLKGEEKKLASARIDQVTSTNIKTREYIETLGKLTVGVAAAVGVFKLAQGAANAWLGDLKNKSSVAGIEFEKATAAWNDSVKSLSMAFGELVVAMAPVIQGFADMLKGATELWGLFKNPLSQLRNDLISQQALRQVETADRIEQAQNEKLQAAYRSAGLPIPSFLLTDRQKQLNLIGLQGRYGAFGGLYSQEFIEGTGRYAEGPGGPRAPRALDPYAGVNQDLLGFAGTGGALAGGARGLFGAAQATFQGAGYRPLGEEVDSTREFLKTWGEEGPAAADAAKRLREEIAQIELQHRQNILATVFGTPTEISAQVEAIKLAQSAFAGFTAVASAGFDALITGSDSFGGAMKKALAEAIRGLANQMFVESLKHAAMAVGSLAIGNFAGAQTHGIAAGLFGAGAAAAAKVAHEMGAGQTGRSAGGGGRSSGGGGGLSRPRPTGGGDGGTNQTVVVIGELSMGTSRLERQYMVKNAIKLSKSRGRGPSGNVN